ncbi:hypothetical protein BDQ12DRAFT_717948 [Crucibulum laeve]|uniref:Essential protein Yae1 N-terminal domain-containing protein n=1 Tax=Crucibulum laeve TaxID=68775 RepID=A0A5C3MHA6_9AGAR|nr:hypothetical protein BDQ12DRAFT_717948 [Crucibulum laeve]
MPTENVPAQLVHESSDIQLNDYDVLSKVREATNSPSPLARLLQEPAVLESLSRGQHKKKEGKRSSRSPHREHRSPFIMALAIAEEERQATHLKALLGNTADRLEYEIHRAEEASGRAQYAERRATEASGRANAAETAKREAEAEAVRREHEAKRYQMQLEGVERELKRVKDEMRRLEKRNVELEESLEQTKEACRKYKTALRDHQIREENREENRQLRMESCFNDGRNEGWDSGYAEGYEEGREDGFEEGLRKGRKEGLREGRERGRNEERKNALEAFDRFLAEETNGHDNNRRRWAQSIYHPDTQSLSELSPTSSPASFRS